MNPQEECPMDEVVKHLTITCDLQHRSYGGKRVKGWMWKVSIPELRYETYTRNLTRTLAIELGWIEEANEELLAEEEQELKEQRKKEASKWAHYRSFPESACDTPPVDRSHSIHQPNI